MPTMELTEFLAPEAILASVRAGTKKQVLQELARKASELASVEERLILDVVLERERLGTTGVGNGIAIPHGKLAGLKRLYGVFARLEKPVDFEAIDEQPVDLVFLLLAPEGAGADHLKALAKVSRLLRDRRICEKLRGSEKPDALYALITEHTANAA
jgi:PTS system nitrogen regulatory IIA component